MANRVEVLLATYNSTDYLTDMLDSLLAQSYDDFHLVVSDDLSTDGTVEMIEARANAFRNPVTVIRRDTPSGSATANFTSLMARSEADYVFLADHDDIWLPEKIAAGLAQLKEAEARLGSDTPILGHCNLAVIDGTGQVTAPSYWAFKQIVPEAGQSLNTALMAPTVTGCALYMNRALMVQALPVPENAVMHDWWLNLVAVVLGEVLFDPEPHIQYRIHGKNASRPREVSVRSSFSQLNRLQRMRHNLYRRIAQGGALLEAHGDAMPETQRLQLESFATIPGKNAFTRRWRILRGGFFWPGIWRNVVGLSFI